MELEVQFISILNDLFDSAGFHSNLNSFFMIIIINMINIIIFFCDAHPQVLCRIKFRLRN